MNTKYQQHSFYTHVHLRNNADLLHTIIALSLLNVSEREYSWKESADFKIVVQPDNQLHLAEDPWELYGAPLR